MRKIYRYNISSNEKLVNTLLFLSKKKTHVSIMMSNRNKSDSILPEYYMQYDLIVGVEKKHDIKVDMNSLLELKKFLYFCSFLNKIMINQQRGKN